MAEIFKSHEPSSSTLIHLSPFQKRCKITTMQKVVIQEIRIIVVLIVIVFIRIIAIRRRIRTWNPSNHSTIRVPLF